MCWGKGICKVGPTGEEARMRGTEKKGLGNEELLGIGLDVGGKCSRREDTEGIIVDSEGYLRKKLSKSHCQGTKSRGQVGNQEGP